MWENHAAVSTNNQDVCLSIIDIFKPLNIKINENSVGNHTAFDTKRIKGDFDLMYSINIINTNEGVEKFYGKQGNENFGKYIPDNSLQELLEDSEKFCRTHEKCKENKEMIYYKIAEDYVNLFLWSPFSFYGFNRDQIKINHKYNITSRNSEFFYQPHKWKMKEK